MQVGGAWTEVMADGRSQRTFGPVTSGRFPRVLTPGALVRREAAPLALASLALAPLALAPLALALAVVPVVSLRTRTGH